MSASDCFTSPALGATYSGIIAVPAISLISATNPFIVTPPTGDVERPGCVRFTGENVRLHDVIDAHEIPALLPVAVYYGGHW
jgi:hypothetical protein